LHPVKRLTQRRAALMLHNHRPEPNPLTRGSRVASHQPAQFTPDRPDEHWLTIHEACALLGVDQTTLRRWSDAGRIPVFRTIGGHRRYAESDVRALIDHNKQGTRGTKPAAPAAPATPPPYLSEYLQAARDRQWFAAFSQESLDQLRGLGRDLVNLAMRYAGEEPGAPDRAGLISEGQRIGVIYGQQSYAAGLTTAETVEAFLYFRFPVVFAVGRLVEQPESPRDRVTRVFSDINQFMDRVLLATVRAREDAATRAGTSRG
jgi:excisionase family DNA binding protein